MAWGYNDYGQLSDGTTMDRYTPRRVTGLTGVATVAAGQHHSLALKGDGTVWTWGVNGSGQFGDGTTTDRSTPVQIPGMSGVAAIRYTLCEGPRPALGDAGLHGS